MFNFNTNDYCHCNAQRNTTTTLANMSGSGLGGLNKSSQDAIVIGLCQSQLFDVQTLEQLDKAVTHVCNLVAKARRSYALMDMIVFPEYAVHGLSMSIDQMIMCDIDGPEVSAFQKACVDNRIWGCFSIMEHVSVPYALQMPFIICCRGGAGSKRLIHSTNVLTAALMRTQLSLP